MSHVYMHNNNNNCKTSIAPVSLTISSSEVQQTKYWRQAIVVIRAWNLRKFMVKKQFQTNMFSFLMKGVYSFRRFNCNMELIPNCWHSHRESMFANIQLSCKNKSCLEMDNLRVLEICNSRQLKFNSVYNWM